MLKIRKTFKKNQKGFTLIELVVVIAILGILAMLAIPKFTGTLSNAKTKTDDAILRTIESAAELCKAETGNYPTNLAGFASYLDTSNLAWANGTAITDISVAADGTITVTPAKPTN